MKNKKLSVVGTAALLFVFQFACEYPAFAHGTHLAPGEEPPHTPPARLPYRLVTPTGSDIMVDFTRNPNICPNQQCPPDLKGLSMVVPRLVNEIDNHKTITTFQLSQGVYQDVVTLEQSGGAFDYFEFLIPPEASTIYHTHLAGWELFYVLGGDPANDCTGQNMGNCLQDNDVVTFALKADADGDFDLADPNNPFSVITNDNIEIQREIPRGSFVALPAGKMHTWSNVGDKPARVLALITPSGISNGFNIVGAPAGLFKREPSYDHPLTDNCEPTGVKKQVDCLLPTEPDFYSFLAVGETFPDISDVLGFTPFPTTLIGERGEQVGRCPVVYDRTGAQISPSEDPAFPCPVTVVGATADPFHGTTFPNPYVLLTFGQTAGELTPAPLTSKLFQINRGESYRNLTSASHEVFRVIEGSVKVSFGGRTRLAPAGGSIFIPQGRRFSLVGTEEGAKVVEFAVAVPERADGGQRTPSR